MRFWVSLLVVGLIALCGVCTVQKAFAVTYQEASNDVASADQALRGAFNGVLDAEKTGANVSALLVRLNDAGGNLTLAEDALAAGNYSDAVGFAGACESLSNGVGADAVVFKSDAVAAAGNWWMTVLFSVAGSVVFAVVLLFVWRRFRSGYLKKMLGSRPEVTG